MLYSMPCLFVTGRFEELQQTEGAFALPVSQEDMSSGKAKTRSRLDFSTFHWLSQAVLSSRWAFVPVFGLFALYVGLRLGFGYQHTRPPLVLTEDLRLVQEFEIYGVQPEEAVLEVNGTPVMTKAEYLKALDTG